MNQRKPIRCVAAHLLLSLMVLWVSVAGLAQSPNPSSPVDKRKGDDNLIICHVFMVMVQIDVTDQDGNDVADLTKNDFTIYEDGVKQEVEYWKNAGPDKQNDQLRYELAYYPPGFRLDGEWRKIRIAVQRKDKEKLNAQFAPKGYYAYKGLLK